MCGIFGILNLTGDRPFDLERFDVALGTLRHRGPDGHHVRQIGDAAVLGHRRLSIIDLSDDSNQPMQRADRYWLTYNGEIFNYVELRDELKALGVGFETAGDTEVLLAAYVQWGPECVSRFNGMWGFAIYDTVERTLFCSRDRYGEKPFSYAMFDGRFFFASEIKAMLAYEPKLVRPDYNVISNFCRTSVGAQHEETWFQDVRRLPPGCNLFLKDGAIRIERYWSYPDRIDRDLSFEQARDRYAALFCDAVRIRMRSDVPLGLTLSAGLDSNSIAYAMGSQDTNSHYCFTASFKDGEQPQRDTTIYADADEIADEAVAAGRAAGELGFASVVVKTDYSDFVAELTRIVWHLESGNSAPAVVPLMQLLSETRKQLKVVLEGQGADELLGGYVGTLVWQNAADLARVGKVREALRTLRVYGSSYKYRYAVLMALRAASNRLPFLSRLHQRSKGIDKAFGPKLYSYRHMPDYPPIAETGRATGVSRALRRQHAGGLVNLLHYGDAISMANSVESRMPFLDHRLVEFVWTLPTEFKVRLGIGKYIHREAMRGLVPGWIIDNPIKYGFCTPVSEQFRKRHDEEGSPLSVLLSNRSLSRGLFDRTGLEALINDHRAGRYDHGPLLFRMLSVELWFRVFVDGDRVAGPGAGSTPVSNGADEAQMSVTAMS